jgi:hypothetical protein
MNRLCPTLVLLGFALAVVVFLFAAFAAVNVLKAIAVGLALVSLASLMKALCCDCPKLG